MDHVILEHGDGGLRTQELIKDVFLSRFSSPILHALGDSALLPLVSRGAAAAGDSQVVPAGHLAFTTDSYVVHPAVFPGGNIGKLAVAGTVNDLSVAGATPLFLSAGFILEEGLSFDLLRDVVEAMYATAEEAGVQIVTGDTKVVPRGQADQLYINTAGVGVVPEDVVLGFERIQPRDNIIVNGGIGEHGVAVLATRAGLEFETPVLSDCAPLNHLIATLLQDENLRAGVRFMRDATRGGVVGVLKEVSTGASVDILVAESSLPITPGVRGACELLGLDPLYLANEGKVIVVVAPEVTGAVLNIMHQHPLGQHAATIGQVTPGNGKVLLRTRLGGTRRIEPLSGAPLPRIC